MIQYTEVNRPRILQEKRCDTIETNDRLAVSDLAQKVRETPNVAEVIANTLTDFIISARLKPGEFLRQEDLAQQFGVSRIPVRDALHILERRGLAETVPRRGVRVKRITRKTVVDMYGLREALEVYAAREACRNIVPEDLDRLREIIEAQKRCVKSGDIRQFIEWDARFHEEVCRLANNEAISEALNSIWGRINQMRSVARVDREWGTEWALKTISNHEAYLRALEVGNPDRVAEVVSGILRQSSERLASKLEQLQWLEGRQEPVSANERKRS